LRITDHRVVVVVRPAIRRLKRDHPVDLVTGEQRLLEL